MAIDYRALGSTLGTGASDYDLYAAATGDPLVNAVSRAGASKLGGGETLIKDLVMLLQSMAGIENGGVAMSQNMRAGVMRGGIMGVTPGGQTGMINGMDVASQQAANAMQQQMLRTFTNPVTGLGNHRASGLDQAELGRLGGYMLGQGVGLSNGPMFQGEVMNQGRIDQLRKEAQAMTPGHKRAEALREVEGLKVGHLRLSETANMGKFTDMMEDGADTLKSIKEVFTSSALKDLDSTFQDLLGGSLAEIGPRAARARMMGIKSMGTTFFGGDMQAAGVYSLGNQNGMAAAIGAGMNIDPQTAKELFGKLASAIASEADISGMTGQYGQTAAANVAAKFGVGMHTAGAAEVSAANQRDIGLITNENTEALALVALKQRTGATMADADKSKIAAALQKMSGADTVEKQNSARLEMEALFQQLAGTSTGNYIANAGGTAKVLGNLNGASSAQLMKANWEDLQQRNQNMLRDNLANESDQVVSATGMTRDQYIAFGMTGANLSNQKAFDIQTAMEESDPQKRQELLDKLGLDKDFQAQLMKQKNGGILAQIRAGATQGPNMENFVGTGQTVEQQERMFQDFIKNNQYSDSSNTDDFTTGLIRGMLGGKAMTGKDVLEKAGKLGLDVTKLSATGGKIDATSDNAKALRKVLGAAGMTELGLSDEESVRKLLEGPGGQQSIIDYLGKEGAYGIKDGVYSVLGKEDATNAKRALEDITHNNLLKKMGAADPKFAREKDESDESYSKRYKRILIGQMRSMATTSFNADANSGWSQMDDLIKKMTGGDKGAETAWNAMVAGGAMESPTIRKAARESVDRQLAALQEKKTAGKGKNDAGVMLEGDDFAKFAKEKETSLSNLRESLLDADNMISSSNTTVNANGAINIYGSAPTSA